MRRLRSTYFSTRFALMALGGCTPAAELAAPDEAKPVPAPVQQAAPADTDGYSAALHQAFTRYEAEVHRAAELTLRSEAEVEAVRASLGEVRFDRALQEALSTRGLTAEGLNGLALENPDFFHAQQRLYWGRLARARQTVENLHVTPELALADTGMR